jgi:hypothetical protein
MSTDDWRITKSAIEAEMLRLAALLSSPSRSTTMPPGLARREVNASNLALRDALRAVNAQR